MPVSSVFQVLELRRFNAAKEPSANVPTLWLLQYVVGLFVTMQLMATPLLLALCRGLATAASFLSLLLLPQVAWEGIRLNLP